MSTETLDALESFPNHSQMKFELGAHPPLEAPKLFLQPINSWIDPQMHFFNQLYHVEPVIEQQRMLPYGSGFGGFIKKKNLLLIHRNQPVCAKIH
jgi:hypothetical protein